MEDLLEIKRETLSYKCLPMSIETAAIQLSYRKHKLDVFLLNHP